MHKNLFLAGIPVLLRGSGRVFEVTYCEYDQRTAENRFFNTSLKLLNECINCAAHARRAESYIDKVPPVSGNMEGFTNPPRSI